MLEELIKIFAAMPDREGVLKAFDRVQSNYFGYDALRLQIEAMPQPVPLPEVKDFIFGMTQESINAHIKNIEDVAMMVEYGIFKGTGLFAAGNRNMQFMMSVFIFKPNQNRNIDVIEETMLMDQLLGIARRMIKHLEDLDRNTCAAKRFLGNEVTILPIQPFQLLNVHGWEVSFSKQADHFFFW